MHTPHRICLENHLRICPGCLNFFMFPSATKNVTSISLTDQSPSIPPLFSSTDHFPITSVSDEASFVTAPESFSGESQITFRSFASIASSKSARTITRHSAVSTREFKKSLDSRVCNVPFSDHLRGQLYVQIIEESILVPSYGFFNRFTSLLRTKKSRPWRLYTVIMREGSLYLYPETFTRYHLFKSKPLRIRLDARIVDFSSLGNDTLQLKSLKLAAVEEQQIAMGESFEEYFSDIRPSRLYLLRTKTKQDLDVWFCSILQQLNQRVLFILNSGFVRWVFFPFAFLIDLVCLRCIRSRTRSMSAFQSFLLALEYLFSCAIFSSSHTGRSLLTNSRRIEPSRREY